MNCCDIDLNLLEVLALTEVDSHVSTCDLRESCAYRIAKVDQIGVIEHLWTRIVHVLGSQLKLFLAFFHEDSPRSLSSLVDTDILLSLFCYPLQKLVTVCTCCDGVFIVCGLQCYGWNTHLVSFCFLLEFAQYALRGALFLSSGRLWFDQCWAL